MKKNATIIAAILFAAGASQAQQDSDRYKSSPSQYDTAPVTSTETLERDARQNVVPPTTTETPAAIQHDPEAVGGSRGSVSAQVNGENYEADAEDEFQINDSERDTDYEAEHSLHQNSDISADSSRRGGSLDARGYRQNENDDELEGPAHPLNPGNKADSSLRGGSIYAREREWNHDAEPSSGQLDDKRWMKADSSIRGGSIEARGGREAMKDSDQFGSSGNFQYDPGDTRDDFGQGSSATWESDQGQGSVRGSANWNPEDDLLRDGMDVEAQSTIEYERDNDASVGGAARSETGSATLDDVELEYNAQPGVDRPSSLRDDLNSSEQLEENISGEFELNKQGETKGPDFRSSTERMETSPSDPNTLDTGHSSITSTDIVHGDTDIEISTESDLSSDIDRENMEASGAAAESESGKASSSDVSDDDEDVSNSFQSNDPALRSSSSTIQENDLGFLYSDNRAHGVGSLATGEFGAAAAAQSGRGMSDEALASEVKGKLTRESTSVHGPARDEVARNVQVSAENGDVTLKGTVASERDKQILEIQAAEMPGVRNVKNELTVTPEADAATRDLIRGRDLEDRTSDLQD
jgi:osmotically-inducible protein OsmY